MGKQAPLSSTASHAPQLRSIPAPGRRELALQEAHRLKAASASAVGGCRGRPRRARRRHQQDPTELALQQSKLALRTYTTGRNLLSRAGAGLGFARCPGGARPGPCRAPPWPKVSIEPNRSRTALYLVPSCSSPAALSAISPSAQPAGSAAYGAACGCGGGLSAGDTGRCESQGWILRDGQKQRPPTLLFQPGQENVSAWTGRATLSF